MAKKEFPTLHIPHDASVPDGMQSARRYDYEGDGFTLIFTLPFKVQDVYSQLVAEKQLGVDHTNIKIELSGTPDAAAEKLQAQLKVTASDAEAADIQKWNEGISGKPNVLFVGVKRKVIFPDGAVESELIDLQPCRKIQWRQLTSDRETNMLGKTTEVEDLPKVTLDLEEMADGTSVRMTYDFFQIKNKKTDHVLNGAEMSQLLSQATQGWSADMKRRGYSPLTESEDGIGLTPRSAVVRSTKFMQSDQEEEQRMKQAMLGAAAK